MMQRIKKEFFAYRNGLLADTLRTHGDPHKVIFGLNVPQIAAIAHSLDFQTDSDNTKNPYNTGELAIELWADREVRESRLLATYLFDPNTTSIEQAIELAKDVRTTEEADMLAFRLFKRMANPERLFERLQSEPATATAAKSLLPHLR